MPGEIGFIIKVFLISTGIAIAIKYIAPYLAISASTGGVLASVLLPSISLAVIFGWRSLRDKSP